MKVAFDVHGTLDRSPQMVVVMMKMFEVSGHEVFIISGPPEKEIYEELVKINLDYFHNFKNILSVVDFAKLEGVPMDQHPNGSWYCDDFYWWRSKGLMCKKVCIDLIFDNDLRYAKHMPKTTNFVHWDRKNFIGI